MSAPQHVPAVTALVPPPDIPMLSPTIPASSSTTAENTIVISDDEVPSGAAEVSGVAASWERRETVLLSDVQRELTQARQESAELKAATAPVAEAEDMLKSLESNANQILSAVLELITCIRCGSLTTKHYFVNRCGHSYCHACWENIFTERLREEVRRRPNNPLGDVPVEELSEEQLLTFARQNISLNRVYRCPHHNCNTRIVSVPFEVFGLRSFVEGMVDVIPQLEINVPMRGLVRFFSMA